MQICFLNPPGEYYSSASGGAIATCIMEEASLLIARGHKVSILTRTGKGESYKTGKIVPVQVKNREELNIFQRGLSSKVLKRLIGWDADYYEYYLLSFMKELRNLSPEPKAVVVFNDVVAPKYIKKVLPNAKVVVYLQNAIFCEKKFVKNSLAFANMFVSNSVFIKDYMVEAYGIPEEKITVVLNGVNLEIFKPRENYLEKNSALRVLYIGRIDKSKGPDIVVDAVGMLKKEGVPIHLTVMGDVWFYPRIGDLVDPYSCNLKKRMIETGTEYLGYVKRENVPALIRKHDVACVISRWDEPFGLVVLEAMASGCVVISSDKGGLPESTGGASIFVDPNDCDSVASCLRLLATDNDIVRAQKLKSVERAKKASWAVTVDILERILV